MLRIALATTNRGKIREFQRLLEDVPVRLLSLAELAVPAPVESGATFIANARLKARQAVLATGLPALADDSGLCVDALGGGPGIYSARFAGLDASDAANRDRLLCELAAIPGASRAAHFHCALVHVAPHAPEPLVVTAVEATVAGEILTTARGAHGFGYDALFLLPSVGLTFAEMSEAQKSHHSHRAAAVRQALPAIREFARRQLQEEAARRHRAEVLGD